MITRREFNRGLLGSPLVACTAATEALGDGFRTPPDGARPWVYWWWLNGYVTREGILRDLDEMRRQGIGGVLVFNAGGGPTPKSTAFMSPEWRELFRFATVAAGKRGIVVSLNLCSGWNAGGPWVRAGEAAQTVVFSETTVTGPRRFEGVLPEPPRRDDYYRHIAVLAYARGEHALRGESFQELSDRMEPDGHLKWEVPAGEWLILRMGATLAPRGRIKFHGAPDGGYEIDPFRADAMERHFAATAERLLAGGGNFKGVSIDSWEMGRPDWTPLMPEEFRHRRGYDAVRYLGALAGKTIDNPQVTARFREDFDRTLSDLTVDNYYGRLAELAHRRSLVSHAEAAGYQKSCVDSLQAMGRDDMPMGEFWARIAHPEGYIHQRTRAQLRFHDSIKLASSAAHIYGRPLVLAEAFTVYHPDWVHWNQFPFALKDIGDRAFCQGLNLSVLCFYVHQPELDAKPGYQWPGCGTNFDRNITWWPMMHAWTRYLARCQHMLQQGRFVADFCYFYGESAPAYVPSKDSMDPALPAGFDCDTINAEALMTRLWLEGDRLVLPDGVAYKYLILPARTWTPPPQEIFRSEQDAVPGPGNGLPPAMSAPVLRKIRELVEAGATVAGPRPLRAPGLARYPHSDSEIEALAGTLWGEGPSGERRVGKGRVIWGRTLEEILRADGVAPDFEARGGARFDYIHRVDGATEIYFVSNQENRARRAQCLFRVTGRQPELWDPVTGEIRTLTEFSSEGGRTVVTMEFAPRQSLFVVFRAPAAARRPQSNFPEIRPLRELEGPWEVSFDPEWGGPKRVTFDHLQDWTARPEQGIRYYSGTATYRKKFELLERARAKRLFLALGTVHCLAEVRLNGRNLGVVWCAPWKVEITEAVRERDNELEIDVVNLWPNRLIGDAGLPPEKRLTKTNVATFRPGAPLLPSGLLGPVTIDAAIA